MPKIELPPTKSSLRTLKDDLSFAYEGYDLLNQKREILAMEIIKHIGEIRKVETELSTALRELYGGYRNAAVDMGSELITLKSSTEKRSFFFYRELFSLLGMKLPKMRISFKNMRPPAALEGTTASYDEAKKRSRKALEVLVAYASITKTIIMLSRELKKVQRRVNALEKIFIPQHEEAKKYIQERLEEMEREEVFVKKLIREQSSKPVIREKN